MSRPTTSPEISFCISYWSKNLNILEFILCVLWFIFYSFTGCIHHEIGIPIGIGLIAIVLFELYGLITKSIWVNRISFILRCLQVLTTLGFLIFVAITNVDTSVEEENLKWWKFTKKNKETLVCLLSIIAFLYICKVVLQLKISQLISQENMEKLPTAVKQNRIIFSISNKHLDVNLKRPPVILKSISERKVSIYNKPKFTSRAM